MSNVVHPKHYNSHPSGVECIDIAEHLSFNLGNALKYLWRLHHKGEPKEQIEKALFYLSRERERVSRDGIKLRLWTERELDLWNQVIDSCFMRPDHIVDTNDDPLGLVMSAVRRMPPAYDVNIKEAHRRLLEHYEKHYAS